MGLGRGGGALGRWLGRKASDQASDRAPGGEAGAGGGDGVLGRVPQGVVDDEDCGLRTSLETSLELRGLGRVADNAQQQYVRSRPAPSPESIRRAKELDLSGLGLHPLFSESLCRAGGGWRQAPWSPLQLHVSLRPPQARASRRRSCSSCGWWTASGTTAPGR